MVLLSCLQGGVTDQSASQNSYKTNRIQVNIYSELLILAFAQNERMVRGEAPGNRGC